ncbi:LLM class F420-dependent oxidoreductase [Microbacterium aquimaris]|uniref:LLM class F420-dependent oxidoreductase n=1 Tax=Microbacterium aquimaris TaxID=459816 RepID=UPI002AD580FF|nr:LLM class F420-dependent oxidoreductase [Microbacterium aquimaris]MDZ8276784.1 LLM class F420-dependent oxidoreductase [Microbacterium aquimaris]
MEYCIFTEPQQGYSYDDQLALAQAAESHGFDGFFRSDHYLRMGDGDPQPGPTDAWTTLAGLARETSRIRLGTLVSSVTYRYPGVLAIQVAGVDAMSNGRAELGLGTGWFEQEHRAYGIPFPDKRFGLLEEQLEVVTGLWNTPVGQTYSHSGPHYTLEDSPALPKPVQSPMPVIVGGGGPKRTPAIAARFASEFNIGFVDEPTVAEKFATVSAACERIDRDPATLKRSVALTTLAGDPDDVRRHAAVLGRDLADISPENHFIGDAATIAEKVHRLAALGAERIYFQLFDLADLDHLDYLGREVLPLLPR